MATKHRRIIQYIETLPIGEKISVRSIAKKMNVSEGTAYRAIKDAEEYGLVTTIQRVGTIRIERKRDNLIDHLTFNEVIKVIDGEILGGRAGLNKKLNRFFIGAMTENAMLRYLSEESLMIIGNREHAQKVSLRHGAAVLITGGFDANKDIIDLGNTLELPLMSTSYDTFTVASMINRAMTDQLIKKEIMLIEHIYTRMEDTDYLNMYDTIHDYRALNNKNNHSRFPVVNSNNRIVGMLTARDVVGKEDQTLVERVMTRNPLTVKSAMSVASVAHSMIWDGLEVMPVVTDDLTLIGIISRQDIMKAMQSQQRQSHVKDTISDQVNQLIEDTGKNEFTFMVTPQMTNSFGNVSFGVLNEVISETTFKLLSDNRTRNVVLEQIQLHYFKVIQLGSEIVIKPRIFDESRRSARLDIDIISENGLSAKALLTCQFIQKR